MKVENLDTPKLERQGSKDVLLKKKYKTMNNNNELSKSVNILAESLKNDPELYYGYQANIAMAFQDEYNRWVQNIGRLNTFDYLHEISNNAAKNFLDSYINISK